MTSFVQGFWTGFWWTGGVILAVFLWVKVVDFIEWLAWKWSHRRKKEVDLIWPRAVWEDSTGRDRSCTWSGNRV